MEKSLVNQPTRGFITDLLVLPATSTPLCGGTVIHPVDKQAQFPKVPSSFYICSARFCLNSVYHMRNKKKAFAFLRQASPAMRHSSPNETPPCGQNLYCFAGGFVVRRLVGALGGEVKELTSQKNKPKKTTKQLKETTKDKDGNNPSVPGTHLLHPMGKKVSVVLRKICISWTVDQLTCDLCVTSFQDFHAILSTPALR